MSNVLAEIDKFVSVTFPSYSIPISEKLTQGKALYDQGMQIYQTSADDPTFQEALNQKLWYLRRMLAKLSGEPVPEKTITLKEKLLSEAKIWLAQCPASNLELENKIARTQQYISKVGATFTRTELSGEPGAILTQLRTLFESLRAKVVSGEREQILLTTPQAFIAGVPQPPKISVIAQGFITEMRDTPISDRATLSRAIVEGEKLFYALKETIGRMNTDEYKIWNTRFQGQMRTIGDLVVKWKKQIGFIDQSVTNESVNIAKEAQAATETQQYVASVEAGQARATVMNSAEIRLRDEMARASRIFDFCLGKSREAWVKNDPTILPMAECSTAIRNLEAVITATTGTASLDWISRAQSTLNGLKRMQAELKVTQADLTRRVQMGSGTVVAESMAATQVAGTIPLAARQVLSQAEIDAIAQEAGPSDRGAKEAVISAAKIAIQRAPELASEIKKDLPEGAPRIMKEKPAENVGPIEPQVVVGAMPSRVITPIIPGTAVKRISPEVSPSYEAMQSEIGEILAKGPVQTVTTVPPLPPTTMPVEVPQLVTIPPMSEIVTPSAAVPGAMYAAEPSKIAKYWWLLGLGAVSALVAGVVYAKTGKKG